jgi:hypothetical protein
MDVTDFPKKVLCHIIKKKSKSVFTECITINHQSLFSRFGLTTPKTLHFVADKISYRTPPQVILR